MIPPPGIILAGGQSQRMGRDKALLPLAGRPMIHRTIERLAPQTTALAIAGPVSLGQRAGLPAIEDGEAQGSGPLAGILAGIRLAPQLWPQATHLITVPVDCPFLPDDLVARLMQKAGPLPVAARSLGRLHPVVTLWPVTLGNALEMALAHHGKRSVSAFLESTGHRSADFQPFEVPGGTIDPFFNMNTPQDLEIAERILRQQATLRITGTGFSPPETERR